MVDDVDAGWTKIRISQTVEELLQFGPSIEVGVAASRNDDAKRIKPLLRSILVLMGLLLVPVW